MQSDSLTSMAAGRDNCKQIPGLSFKVAGCIECKVVALLPGSEDNSRQSPGLGSMAAGCIESGA